MQVTSAETWTAVCECVQQKRNRRRSGSGNLAISTASGGGSWEAGLCAGVRLQWQYDEEHRRSRTAAVYTSDLADGRMRWPHAGAVAERTVRGRLREASKSPGGALCSIGQRMGPLCLALVLLRLLSELPEVACFLQEYRDCRDPSLLRCGRDEFNISYPFLGADRKRYCGVGSLYELSCRDGVTPVIDIGGKSYRVRRVDYEAGILGVADLGASLKEKCPLAQYRNATLDYSPFQYTGHNVNLTLYGNCTPIIGLISNLLEVPCLAHRDRQSYLINPEQPPAIQFVIDFLRSSCNSTAIVPVRRAAVRSLKFDDPESLRSAMEKGFNLRWMAGYNSWCRSCISSAGVCGYNSSTGTQICFCSENASPGSCSLTTPEGAKGINKSKKIAIGVGTGVGVLLIASILCFLVYRRKMMRARTRTSTMLVQTASLDPPSQVDPEMGSTHYCSTHLFKYDELHAATDGFSHTNELGNGGFGTVYKGKLRDGRMVAVKRLHENNYKRMEQFMNEVAILNRLQHPNLVTLYGCTSRHSRELLLVYEYVPNGTVADHLHGDRATEGSSTSPIMSWPIRMSIAVETATALAYLHKVEPPIIHRDVKTSNILLDDNFHVKVADFGLSRLFTADASHVSTAPQGSPGYVDPEYHRCYQLTDKSDVYSFGVVLAELISSKPAVDMTRHSDEINLSYITINKIQNDALHELVDPALEFETDWAVRRMIKLVAELAFRCLQAEKVMRPSMEEVVEVLRGIRDCQLDEAEGSRDRDRPERDDTSLLKE